MADKKSDFIEKGVARYGQPFDFILLLILLHFRLRWLLPVLRFP